MPINRYFVDASLDKDTTIKLCSEEAKHCIVMRAVEGDSIELINGQALLAQGTILSLSKKLVEVKITFVGERKLAAQKLILVQSYTKASKIDWILEKGCELGVHRFIFFKTKRAEKELSNKRERHKAILIASIKQCGRLDLPEIEYTDSLKPMDQTYLFFGDLSENAPFYPKYLEKLEDKKNIAFINGPESGFTEEEIKEFKKKLNATGVSLHPNVLRAETAAICAMAYSQLYLH